MAHAYEKTIKSSQKQLKILASIDPLTGLLNRSLLAKTFAEAKAVTDFTDRVLAIVALDIDRFKTINDIYGHDIGDDVLKALSGILREHCEQSNHAFRMGGEEFCIIMPNTDPDAASTLAEQVRQDFAQTTFSEFKPGTTLSVSCGVASSNEATVTFKALHGLADERLFMAKNRGRNQVVDQVTADATNSGLKPDS